MSAAATDSPRPSGAPSSTPILDLAVPIPRGGWSLDLNWQHVLIILGVFFGIGVLTVLVLVFPPLQGVANHLKGMGDGIESYLDSFGIYGPATFLCLFFVLSFLAATLHELGHLAAGRLVGFKPRGLVVGYFSFSFRNGRLRARIIRSKTLQGLARVEINTICRLHRKLAIYIAAGPITNLLCASAALAAAKLGILDGLPAPVRSTNYTFVFICYMQFIINLWPRHLSTGRYTDGARLFMLATSREKTRRWLSLIALEIQQRAGVKPTSWNRNWIKAASCMNDRSNDALRGHLLAYACAFDKEDCANGAIFLEKCLENASSASDQQRAELMAEALIFQGWCRGDRAKAYQWFHLMRKARQAPPLVGYRAALIVDWLANRPTELAAHWAKGMALIRKLPPGQREGMEESWIEWKAKLDERFPPGTQQTLAQRDSVD
jgi:hypothetical protein